MGVIGHQSVWEQMLRGEFVYWNIKSRVLINQTGNKGLCQSFSVEEQPRGNMHKFSGRS